MSKRLDWIGTALAPLIADFRQIPAVAKDNADFDYWHANPPSEFAPNSAWVIQDCLQPARLQFSRGLILLKGQELVQSKKALDECVRLDPAAADAFCLRGKVPWRMGEYDQVTSRRSVNATKRSGSTHNTLPRT